MSGGEKHNFFLSSIVLYLKKLVSGVSSASATECINKRLGSC